MPKPISDDMRKKIQAEMDLSKAENQFEFQDEHLDKHHKTSMKHFEDSEKNLEQSYYDQRHNYGASSKYGEKKREIDFDRDQCNTGYKEGKKEINDTMDKAKETYRNTIFPPSSSSSSSSSKSSHPYPSSSSKKRY